MQLPPPNPLRFEPCPATGEGVHIWLLAQANRCRLGGLSAATAEVVLRDATQTCGRRVPNREIQDAIRKAYAAASAEGTAIRSPRPVQSPWPRPDPDLIARATASGYGLADLWELSPIRFEDSDSHAEELIDALFPGDPLLCVAKALPADAQTMPRSAWRGRLASCALIVPSPMSAPTGKTQDGHESHRCLDNTGPRRFLVVEFDSGDIDSQAARLLHLRTIAPLTLAVHSGGKSIHGWFYCEGIAETALRQFMSKCVALGADPATWNRCQLVRCPDGTRDNGQPQRAFYFNPATIRP